MIKGRRKKPSIHLTVKTALGYDANEGDGDVYADWRERTGRVCKPCWELKYCPYGPLVEQSPLLPPLKAGMKQQQKYFEECLNSGLVGNLSDLTPELKEQYEEWLDDDDLLARQAIYQLKTQRAFDSIPDDVDDEEKILQWLGGPLPPIHKYRVEYDVGESDEIDERNFAPETWKKITALAEELKTKYQNFISTGIVDNRHPLEPARAAWFRKRLNDFEIDQYPDDIPQVFTEAECNVFGHICPVFFAAEALTETEETRRIGRRHLNFAKMMRIVRRDDYRCQHCFKQLRDNEVEFDHIIPVAKGGSSEEHNIRLTCFDCNRDKSDNYVP